jgi:hypothetical protein
MKEDVKGKISPTDWAQFFLGVPAPDDARRCAVLTHFRLSSRGIRNDVRKQSPPQDDLSVLIRFVKLKDVLGNVQPDDGNLHECLSSR